jgi:hypothetical protein
MGLESSHRDGIVELGRNVASKVVEPEVMLADELFPRWYGDEQASTRLQVLINGVAKKLDVVFDVLQHVEHEYQIEGFCWARGA